MPSREEHISDEILSERLDGRLTLAEVRRVEAHLASCAECSERAEGLSDVRSGLRALGTAPLPRDFRLDLAGRVDLPPRAGSTAHVQTLPGWMVARFASALVTFVGILLLLGGLSALYGANITGSATRSPLYSDGAGSASTPANTTPGFGGVSPLPTSQYGSDSSANTATATPTSSQSNPIVNQGAESAEPASPLAPAVPIAAGALAIVAGTLGLTRIRPKRP